MPDTSTARIYLNEHGLVFVQIHPNAYQSVADAKANLAAAIDATAGIRRPLLVDIRQARPLDAEARHHYSGQKLVDAFSALAMIVDASPFGRMMGTCISALQNPEFPHNFFPMRHPRWNGWPNTNRSRELRRRANDLAA